MAGRRQRLTRDLTIEAAPRHVFDVVRVDPVVEGKSDNDPSEPLRELRNGSRFRYFMKPREEGGDTMTGTFITNIAVSLPFGLAA